MSQIIKVGMADMNVCRAPDRIATLGLGSCVGVVLYDPILKICGLIHIMLPDSTAIANKDNEAKFADTGILLLVDKLKKMGARPSFLRAKMAGGARMFAFKSASEMLNVGERNAEAARTVLNRLGIVLVASDCGGEYGRTIEFDPETCNLYIRSIGKPEKYI